MWNYVGIVRTDKRLERAAHRIQLLKGRDPGVLYELPRHSDLLELRNLVSTAGVDRPAERRRERKAAGCTPPGLSGSAAVAMNTVLVP
jgi:L-aspartate oxidase